MKPAPRSDAKVAAKIPVRIASEISRTEFVMVSLVEERTD